MLAVIAMLALSVFSVAAANWDKDDIEVGVLH